MLVALLKFWEIIIIVRIGIMLVLTMATGSKVKEITFKKVNPFGLADLLEMAIKDMDHTIVTFIIILYL